MKLRNVLVCAMLGLNVMTAYGATAVTAGATAGATAAVVASVNANLMTTANTVTSNMMANAGNTAIVKCRVQYINKREKGEWFGREIPSMQKTTEECEGWREEMEMMNNVRYKWGKAKGMFNVNGNTYAMMELVEVN